VKLIASRASKPPDFMRALVVDVALNFGHDHCADAAVANLPRSSA
jgi:hypothetical protein